jgi:hypothetical protein
MDAVPAAVVAQSGAQTMHGFGASGAWWPNDLVNFSPDVQDRVAGMLFGQDGLALSVYRYNIGGGGGGVRSGPRAAETFLVRPGEYDWSRDAGGRLFLKKAAEMGVPALIGFVNSAPVVWTTNGQCCGGNLVGGAEVAYARYLADVVVHLQADEGVSLSYVSPMNEPDSGFAGGAQEGMAVPVRQRAALVRAVAAELAQRAPFAQVIGDESSRILDQFLPEAPIWLGIEGAASSVAAVAHHLYDFPIDLELRAADLLRATLGKAMWMTEICCFDSRTGRYGRQYDPTIAGGHAAGEPGLAEPGGRGRLGVPLVGRALSGAGLRSGRGSGGRGAAERPGLERRQPVTSSVVTDCAGRVTATSPPARTCGSDTRSRSLVALVSYAAAVVGSVSGSWIRRSLGPLLAPLLSMQTTAQP